MKYGVGFQASRGFRVDKDPASPLVLFEPGAVVSARGRLAGALACCGGGGEGGRGRRRKEKTAAPKLARTL